jgi:hypothetical protein
MRVRGWWIAGAVCIGILGSTAKAKADECECYQWGDGFPSYQYEWPVYAEAYEYETGGFCGDATGGPYSTNTIHSLSACGVYCQNQALDLARSACGSCTNTYVRVYWNYRFNHFQLGPNIFQQYDCGDI